MKYVLFAGLLFSQLLSASPKMKNYSSQLSCPSADVREPSNTEEVVAIVNEALSSGRKVMTAAPKFSSQIDAACTEASGIQISSRKLNKIISLDKKKKIVTVQSGVRLSALNEFLKANGLALNMIAEGGFFTIGGVLGSGTHGSQLEKNVSTSDQVVSMKIVNGRGELVELSGSDLKAAAVNLGLLGVVVEASIQVEDLTKVRADIYSGDDSALAERLVDLARNNYSVSSSWFPGINQYAATVYNHVPLSSPGNAVNYQAAMEPQMYELFKAGFKGATADKSGNLACMISATRHLLRSQSYFVDANDTSVKVENPVGYAPDMQYFKCQGKARVCPWDVIPMVVAGFSIPLSELGNWMKDARKVIDEYKKKSASCFPLNGIYFRFGPASDKYLALNYGRETVFIDIEYVQNLQGSYKKNGLVYTPEAPRKFALHQELEQMSVMKYQAKPHWGKNTQSIFSLFDIRKSYPDLEKFISFKKKMDPKDTFTNDFWNRMLNGTSTSRASCVVDGSCYCSQDSDCYNGLKCLEGLGFKSAKVCR